MALRRIVPTCYHCGEEIAKAVYKDQSKIPSLMRVIGDNFLRWDYISHKCKKYESTKSKYHKFVKNKETMTGIELIAKERKEQIEKHGRTILSDIRNNSKSQLIIAAINLIDVRHSRKARIENRPKSWFIPLWSKMCSKTPKERLIIAGALIAAEIDRLEAIDTELAGEDLII